MASIKVAPKVRSSTRMLLYALGMVPFVSIIFFCSFYLVSTRQQLIDWFTSLNDCFYDRSGWTIDYFTPSVKSQGDFYCFIAIVVSAFLLAYLIWKLRTRKPMGELILHFRRSDVICLLICLVCGIVAWCWGNIHALPAYDEVFSAQNVAGIHPFQAVAYYMMPNNHLVFNLLNNVFFHWAADKVVSGRIISLCAYVVLISCLYLWLRSLLSNRWLALLAAVTLSLQFFTWGFSFQARGYELYLLAEWCALISLLRYISSAKPLWLNVNIACVIGGYFCLPSFLYFHLAQLLFLLVYCLFSGQWYLKFWLTQMAALSLTFLCYLPALCFSGVSAITNNTYVTPLDPTITGFWNHVYPYFTGYYHHVFSEAHFGSLNFDVLLLLLPLLLLFARRPYRSFGLFYVCLLFVFFLLTSVMKRLPFERNLIGHYSVALAGLLLLAHWSVGLMTRKNVQMIVTSIVAALFLTHFVVTNPQHLTDRLYEHDVNDAYKRTEERLKIIPAGSLVAFSDAEFYSLYICKKKRCIVGKCPSGNETYYLRQEYEPLPAGYTQKYILLSKTWGYEIYKRK